MTKTKEEREREDKIYDDEGVEEEVNCILVGDESFDEYYF